MPALESGWKLQVFIPKAAVLIYQASTAELL